MLAVSARRHGLLLAFWLNAMLYEFFCFSFGAAVATGTPFGAAELPGSLAVASLHDAEAPAAASGDFELAVPANTVSAASAATTPAAPADATIFLNFTAPSQEVDSNSDERERDATWGAF